MNKLALILSLVFTFTSSSAVFASISTSSTMVAVNYDQQEVIEMVDNNIGADMTCLDEYLTREQQLKRFLIWAPPAAVVGVPATFAVTGLGSALLVNALNVGGWDAIGYTLMGAVGGGFVALGSFVALETIKGL